MTEPDLPMTRREIEEKIIARAWNDEEFRRKFVADPKGQFEAHLGTKLPKTLTMTAHEETENSIHFVIPMKPQVTLGELSDEDLESIAGGRIGEKDVPGAAAISASFAVTGLGMSWVVTGVLVNEGVRKISGKGWGG